MNVSWFQQYASPDIRFWQIVKYSFLSNVLLHPDPQKSNIKQTARTRVGLFLQLLMGSQLPTRQSITNRNSLKRPHDVWQETPPLTFCISPPRRQIVEQRSGNVSSHWLVLQICSSHDSGSFRCKSMTLTHAFQPRSTAIQWYQCLRAGISGISSIVTWSIYNHYYDIKHVFHEKKWQPSEEDGAACQQPTLWCRRFPAGRCAKLICKEQDLLNSAVTKNKTAAEQLDAQTQEQDADLQTSSSSHFLVNLLSNTSLSIISTLWNLSHVLKVFFTHIHKLNPSESNIKQQTPQNSRFTDSLGGGPTEKDSRSLLDVLQFQRICSQPKKKKRFGRKKKVQTGAPLRERKKREEEKICSLTNSQELWREENQQDCDEPGANRRFIKINIRTKRCYNSKLLDRSNGTEQHVFFATANKKTAFVT